MKNSKKYVVILFIVMSFCSVKADVELVSPYGMVFSTDELKSLYAQIQIKGDQSYQLQDYVIEKPYKTQMQGIVLSGVYDAEMIPGASVLQFSLITKLSQLRLFIKKISTDTIIYQNINGINAEIFLKGSCENIEIIGSADVVLNAQVNLIAQEKGLMSQTQDVDVQELPQWQVRMGTCLGPAGYDKTLQSEIVKLLSNKQEIAKLVIEPLTEKIEGVAKSFNEKLFKVNETALTSEIQIKLFPETLKVINNNQSFLLLGNAATHLKDESKAAVETVVIKDDAFTSRITQFDQTGIYFSQKWIKESIVKTQQLSLLSYSFSSSSIESLKSLFSSRLYQFFLWPDLMRFSRKVEFLFRLKISELKTFSFIAANDKAVWFDILGKSTIRTQSPAKNKAGEKSYNHYGDFTSDLKTRVWVKMHKGIAIVGAVKPQFKLSFFWNKMYLSMMKPTQGIHVGYFSRKIQSLFKNEKYTMVMPKIEVSENVTLHADEILGDEDILFLKYTTKDIVVKK